MALCNMALADRTLSTTLHAATLVNRGVLHMKAEAFTAALTDYDAAIAEAPDNPDAYINKGIALLHMGNRDADAAAVLTEALAHNPARPELVYFHRASAYEGLGLLRDAYNDYSEAAQLAPDWAEPAIQLQRFKFVRRKTLAG
jgi:tetratricopeptide (TPR) repeat protein